MEKKQGIMQRIAIHIVSCNIAILIKVQVCNTLCVGLTICDSEGLVSWPAPITKYSTELLFSFMCCIVWSWPHKYAVTLYLISKGLRRSTNTWVGPCSATDHTGWTQVRHTVHYAIRTIAERKISYICICT